MTEEDYIRARAKEQTREESEDIIKNYLRPFDCLDECFAPYNIAQERYEKIKEEMKLPKEKSRYTKVFSEK